MSRVTSEEKKNNILSNIRKEIAKEPTYAREIKLLSIERRYEKEDEEERHKQKLRALAIKYDIPPKERATYDELVIMIGMVLETGKSGTKVIRMYAEDADKSAKWVNEILREYENNEVILSMKENKVYIKRDILKNTVTGALNKLSKQVSISKKIDDLKAEVNLLKKNIAAKASGEDWVEEAQRLRDSGMSLQKIGDLVGKKNQQWRNIQKTKMA